MQEWPNGKPGKPRIKGIKMPDSFRQKMSKVKMGIKPNESTRLKFRLAKLGKKRAGDPSKWKHTFESKFKNSLAHRGEKSVNWQGGLSSLNKRLRRSLQYRNWRTAVYQRNGYKCIWCGADKKYLNADHIKQYALIIKENNISTYEQAVKCEELWQVNNGRTLCIDCHKETDTYLNKGKKYV